MAKGQPFTTADSRRCRFANLEANEPANADFVAELPGHAGDMFPDSDFGILLYETLVEQTIRLEEFFELAFHDPGNGLRRAVFDLLRGDFLFLRDDDRVHLIPRDRDGVRGGDLQSDVAHQLFERVAADSGFLAGADLHQHAEFCSGVNVSGNHAVATDFEPLVA